MADFRVLLGDSREKLKELPDKSIDCCITSPPYYGLRDYGNNEQIGLEASPEDYVTDLLEVFKEVKRVLKDDGTFWLNIGDTYNGVKTGNTEIYKHKAVAENSYFKKKKWQGAKNKDLIGIPWMLAFALRDDGWYLRQDIIWHKPNPMPEPAKDRCVKSHEYIFLFSKNPPYYFNFEQIQERAVGSDRPRIFGARNQYGTLRNDIGNEFKPHYKNLDYKGQQNHSMHERRAEGEPDKLYLVRNKRDVWTIATKPVKEAHFATYPEDLIKPCVLAGCRGGYYS